MNNLTSTDGESYAVECLRSDGDTFKAKIYCRSLNHKERHMQIIPVSDTTGRSQIDSGLDKAQRLSYNMINAMQDGVTIFNPDDVLAYCNPAFCRMTGFSMEAIRLKTGK